MKKKNKKFETTMITLKPQNWFRDQLIMAMKETDDRPARNASEIIFTAVSMYEDFDVPASYKPVKAYVKKDKT